MSKILVADDSPEFAEMLMTVLDGVGHTVLTAETGMRALEMSESWEPELIVTDIHMPALNGLELISRIRFDSRSKNIPIIVITAYGELGLELALIAGASLSLPKPLDIKVLIDEVGRLLRSPSIEMDCQPVACDPAGPAPI